MTKAENDVLYDKWEKGMITWHEFLDEMVGRASENDKKFMLRQLLHWHMERLDKIIKETPGTTDVREAYAKQMMVNHKKVAEEMFYVLTAELW